MNKVRTILFLIFIIAIVLFDVNNSSTTPVGNITFLIVLLVSFNKVIKNRIFNNKGTIYLMGFIIWTFSSLIWSPDIGFSSRRWLTVLLLFILLTVILSYIEFGAKILEKSYKAYIGGCLIFIPILYVQGFFNAETLKDASRMDLEMMDINFVGMMMSIACTMCLFFIFNYKTKIYSLFLFIFVLSIFLFKSKGALLVLFSGCLSYYILNYIQKGARMKLIMSICLLCTFFVIIIQTGILGDSFVRVVQMFDFFSGDVEADDSTADRLFLIQYGLNLFLDKPILGYGIGSSDYILKGTYFHNNYIQLLVETGIVGFLLYYSFYISIIKQLWKNRKDRYCKLMFCLMLLLLISDISNATYYHKINYIIIGLSLISVNDSNKYINKIKTI